MLTVEACLALREMGYPQDRWPQDIWFADPEYDDNYYGAYHWHEAPTAVNPKCVWVANPDTGDALRWLEESGQWFLSYRTVVPSLVDTLEDVQAKLAKRWTAHNRLYGAVVAGNPSDLIVAVRNRVKQAEEELKGG